MAFDLEHYPLPVPEANYYDPEAAEDAVDFIESLKHVKGKWAGDTIDLMRWQKDRIIRPLFGLKRPDGTRQYRTATVFIPRKNGKSAIAAPIALYLLFADGEPGAEVYGAAYDRDQASLVFNVAAQMMEENDILDRRGKTLKNQKKIEHLHDPASFYQALSKETRKSEGYNAHGVVFDELHTQKTRDMWDVLTTAQGTRDQPLTFVISTAGEDKKNSICGEVWDYSEKVRDGVLKDPSWFTFICSAEDLIGEKHTPEAKQTESEEDTDEEGDTWRDRHVWYFANPALERPGISEDDPEHGFRKLDEFESTIKKAEEIPAKRGPVLRRYLNIWAKDDSGFIKPETWQQCGGVVKLNELRGRECFGGLDVATHQDIAAWVLAFPFWDDSGQNLTRVDVVPRFYIPEESALERVNNEPNPPPYEEWLESGVLIGTPGNVIDFDWIYDDIRDDADTFNIQSVGFDPWEATWLSVRLNKEGLFMVPVRQGMKSMSPPTKMLVRLLMAGVINHGSDPVLGWMSDNMAVTTDDAENYKPSKKRSSDRIDGIVALIMAIDQIMRSKEDDEDEESVYEKRGLISV